MVQATGTSFRASYFEVAWKKPSRCSDISGEECLKKYLLKNYANQSDYRRKAIKDYVNKKCSYIRFEVRHSFLSKSHESGNSKRTFILSSCDEQRKSTRIYSQ